MIAQLLSHNWKEMPCILAIWTDRENFWKSISKQPYSVGFEQFTEKTRQKRKRKNKLVKIKKYRKLTPHKNSSSSSHPWDLLVSGLILYSTSPKILRKSNDFSYKALEQKLTVQFSARTWEVTACHCLLTRKQILGSLQIQAVKRHCLTAYIGRDILKIQTSISFLLLTQDSDQKTKRSKEITSSVVRN